MKTHILILSTNRKSICYQIHLDKLGLDRLWNCNITIEIFERIRQIITYEHPTEQQCPDKGGSSVVKYVVEFERESIYVKKVTTGYT